MVAPKMARQRGVAVITALLLTTLAITIVASLFWQQQVQVRSIENQRLQLQKQWVLRGALDWARLILREDAKYSSVDTLDEPWAVPLSETRLDQYVENGRSDTDASDATLSGGIIDAQSRYNLRNLLTTDGAVNRSEVPVLERLLSSVQLNPALAQAAADAMAAASPRKSDAGAVDGGAQPMPFTQLDDLLAVPGFTPEAVAKLKDFVILLPRVTPVNVNTAPPEVLAARIDTLAVSDANVLVGMRKSASFRDVADFLQRAPGKPPNVSGNEIAVASSYFLVNGTVRMNRASLTIQALMERNGVNTKLIWVREY